MANVGQRALDQRFALWLGGDPGEVERSAALWRDMRTGGPVHRHGKIIVATGYEPVRIVTANHDWFSSDVTQRRTAAFLPSPSPGPADDGQAQLRCFEKLLMNRRDGRLHAAGRAPLAGALARSLIPGLATLIDTGVTASLPGAGEVDKLDLVEVARAVTGRVVCSLVGAPASDRHEMRALVAAVAKSRHGVMPGDARVGLEGWLGMVQYASTLAASQEREDAPLRGLFRRTFDQHGPRAAAAMLMSILGGQESTATLISSGARELLARRDQWERLRDDPAVIPNAGDELMRLVSPSQAAMRRATRQGWLGAVLVEPDDLVLAVIAGANRDPAVFACPDRLDVMRENARRQIGFGYGPHHCLGLWLARAQTQSVLQVLTRRFPDLRLADTRTDVEGPPNLSSPATLIARA